MAERSRSSSELLGADGFPHVPSQLAERHRHGFPTGRHEVRRAALQCVRVDTDGGPETPPCSVARHRAPHGPPHRVRDPGRSGADSRDRPHRNRSASRRPGLSERLERPTVADSVSQAASRLRPRARRAFSTARPPRVCIRARKPCFFLRFRVLGWNVRFTHGLLERTRDAGPPPRGRSATRTRRRGNGAVYRAPSKDVATRPCRAAPGLARTGLASTSPLVTSRHPVLRSPLAVVPASGGALPCGASASTGRPARRGERRAPLPFLHNVWTRLWTTKTRRI